MKVSIPSRNLILVTTIFLIYIVPLRAEDSPQDYLDAHNKVRAEVGVGPLTWDLKLALYASTHAKKLEVVCTLELSEVPDGELFAPYGENLAMGAWSSGNMSAAQAVEMWVKEKSDYNYSSNTCAPDRLCSSYTQVVWRNSVKLGCAKARCPDPVYGRRTFVYCNYDPRGNGFEERPY
ncbi:unnamed protein product [Eruca vesicaria subsp. sativa]|uniref:SCP domain-containing protein n=1 Tax=Eruca vesicaria subsp. sativa TaxID=29727 RepID=A0ABC8L2U9_ERUVS|nr:unnamed protein product [Eruca vesicaria subsp. sativa]